MTNIYTILCNMYNIHNDSLLITVKLIVYLPISSILCLSTKIQYWISKMIERQNVLLYNINYINK